jgi:ribonuclease BN (tRNA processing enzyme)
MKLIVLGSGTCVPSSHRASPSFLLFAGGRRLLLDMGPGTLRQLARIGVHHDRIEQFFISHFHPDHIADIIHLLFATRIPDILTRRKPFTVTGPEGLGRLIEDLQKVFHGWLDLPDELMEIEELDISNPAERSYNGYTVRSQPLGHTSNSLAYRIHDEGGKSLVYSGDTDLCDAIVELAEGCDLLILECSFPDGGEVEGHLTPAQAGQVAALAGAHKLLLVHFYPEVLGTDIARACRRTYKGELVLGRDLLHITV